LKNENFEMTNKKKPFLKKKIEEKEMMKAWI